MDADLISNNCGFYELSKFRRTGGAFHQFFFAMLNFFIICLNTLQCITGKVSVHVFSSQCTILMQNVCHFISGVTFAESISNLLAYVAA